MLKVTNFRKEYYNVIVSQEAGKNSILTTTRLLKLAQAKLSGLTGEELRKKVAEVIYYKGLSRTDMEIKIGERRLVKALQPSYMETQRDNILASPAFKVLSEMNDKELRNLAATKDGEKLMNKYIRETAKIMQRDKHEKNPMNEKLQNLYKGKSGQKKKAHEPGKT